MLSSLLSRRVAATVGETLRLISELAPCSTYGTYIVDYCVIMMTSGGERNSTTTRSDKSGHGVPSWPDVFT